MTTYRQAAPSIPPWIERQMPSFDRYRVDLGAFRMHVMERGAGRPVLMVHGNPTWGFLYRDVVRALGSDVRAVVPDLIGLGLSDKPQRGGTHTLDNHARWMAKLVERLDLRDVILVVQDWGGAIGTLAFEEQRDRLAGLVILNTVLGPPKKDFRPTAFHAFAKTPVVSDLAFRALQFPQVGMGFAQGDPHSIDGVVADAYRWPLRRFRDRRAPLEMARMVPDSWAHPSIPALQRCDAFARSLELPTHIVWGDRDPVLGTVRSHMQRMFPHAACDVTAAGHFLQEEVPEVIAEAIRGLL